MEGKRGKKFPWIKDVMQGFALSFMDDYSCDVLSILHRNIENEIKIINSSNDQVKAEALYKEITYIYDHMRLKIKQHPEFQNATLSCVKLISQLIRVGLVLTEGLINSEWIERILTAIKLFPGEKVLVYDALLLVNGLKKIHQKPYSTVLRSIMTEDHQEFVTDPLIYMEIILLLRRLKALVLDRFKVKYNILATKIKPPSNLISWLISLDENEYSSYLKNLKYKKIAQQLMKKILPESFIKKIRYMALNQYNFEADSREFELNETEDQFSDMFIIDNVSSATSDNLDMLGNSQKTITKKKNSQRKSKKLHLIDNNDRNLESNIKNKISSICINESDTDINSLKHTITSKKKQKSNISNFNQKIIVSKKKKKSKCNLVKNAKAKPSTILSKDSSYSDSFFSDNSTLFNDVENSTLLHDINYSTLLQTNNNTLNEEDPESNRENKISILHINESYNNTISDKQFLNSNEHIVSKKKKKSKSKNNVVKNTKSATSTTPTKNVPDSTLFFHDVEGSNISEQLNKNSINSSKSEASSEKVINNMYVDKSNADKTIHKQFPASNKHVIVSKKKKKSKSKPDFIKTSELDSTVIHVEDVPDSALFFHDVEGSTNSSKKLKTAHKVFSSSSVPKRDLSEDTDTTDKTALKKKHHKKLKSSKCNEITTPNDSLSNNNDILDSSTAAHEQLASENEDNKQEISFKDDEDVIFLTEGPVNKRKKIASNDDSASDDKCTYFKKLMLEKVSHENKTTSLKISSEHENKSSTAAAFESSKKKKMKGKKENKSESINENTVCRNQNIPLENVTDKNFDEKSNPILDVSVIITENTVAENQIVPLENVVSRIFEDERNSICNVPNAYDSKCSDLCHLKGIDNQSEEKKDNLISQSENTKLLLDSKLAEESSNLELISQTTEKSDQKTVDILNSELEKEDNLVTKNKTVSSHKNDIALVSNVEYKNTENEHNLAKCKETLKPNHTLNNDPDSSIKYPSTENVSENEPMPSQNFNVKSSKDNIHQKDMHCNKSAFNISDSVNVSKMSEDIPNQTKQNSDQDTDKYDATTTDNIFVDSTSCETFDSANPNEYLNNKLVETDLHSITSNELAYKTNLNSKDIHVCLDNKNQENISVTSNNIFHDTLLDSMQSKSELLLNNNTPKNIVKSESKSELKERSEENTCSSVSFDKADLRNIDEDSLIINKSKDNVLYFVCEQNTSKQSNANSKSSSKKHTDMDIDVAENSDDCVGISHIQPQHQQIYVDEKIEESCAVRENNVNCDFSESLNIDNKLSNLDTQIKHDEPFKNLSTKTVVCDKDDNKTVANLENVKNLEQSHVQKKTEFIAVQKTSHPNEEKEIDHFDGKSVEKSVQVLDKLHNEKLSSSMLGNENKTVQDLEKVENAEQMPVQEKTEFEFLQKTSHPSEEKCDHFEEKSEKEDAQVLDKLHDEKIPANLLVNDMCVDKNSIEECSASNKFRESDHIKTTVYQNDALNNVSDDLSYLDGVSNSTNDVQIPERDEDLQMEVKSDEKPEETNIANSQDDIAKDSKNSESDLSNVLSSTESTCSNSMNDLLNKIITSIKIELPLFVSQKVNSFDNSDEVEDNSQDNIMIGEKNNEKDLPKENIQHSNKCSVKIKKSENDVKISVENTDSAIHSSTVIEKPIDACEDSNQLKAVNSQDDADERNLLNSNASSTESAGLDNIHNSTNDVKISVQVIDNIVHSLPINETPIDGCENSDQLKIINSQDDKIIGNENDVKGLSNESISSPTEYSDNINNSAVDAKILDETLNSPTIIEKRIDTCEISDQLVVKSQPDIIGNDKDNLSNERILSLKKDDSVNETPVDVCENSDHLKIVNSQDDKIIGNENDVKNLSNENISSSKECFDNINNSAVDVKILDKTIHSPTIIEKHVDISKNSGELVVKSQHDIIGNDKDCLSNECILSVKKDSVNINHATNDVKVSDVTMQNTTHSQTVIEKPIDANENFHQLKSVNLQKDSITCNENDEKDFVDEIISSKNDSHNINNSPNVAEVYDEIIQKTTCSLTVIEKPIDISKNSEQLKTVNSHNNSSDKDVLNKNMMLSKECSDNTNNLSNNKGPAKVSESTISSLTVVEEPNDKYDNSDQLKDVNSQDNNIINNENDLSKENIQSPNECFNNPLILINDNACQNSDLIKALNSQDHNIKVNENKEKDLSDESITSSNKSSNSIHNSANEAKTFVETVSSTTHSLPEIEKPVDAYENSDQLKAVDLLDDSIKSDESNNKDLSKENISSSECFDNIHNTADDNAISVDACQNSDQIKAVNSLNDSLVDNEKDLSNENFSSSKKTVDLNSNTKLVNDDVSSVKEKEGTLQLPVDSKNVNEIILNNEKSSIENNNAEKKSSLSTTESNFNKRENSPEEMSKNKEKDGDCNLDFQEQYIVIDESYSDIDDCKSDHSEQSIENSSSLKKIVRDKSKCRVNLPSSNASRRHLNDSENEKIGQTIKNTSKISLQKCTSEIGSNISPEPTNKPYVKSDISSNTNCKQLHGNYISEIDDTMPSGNAAASSESTEEISSREDCLKNLCEKGDHQNKSILKENTSEISHKNCASRIDSKKSPESHLSNIKKELLLIAGDTKHSLKDNNSRELNSNVSSVKSQRSSSVLKTEFSQNQEIKFAESGEQIIQRMKRKSVTEYPSEASESLSVSSSCDGEHSKTFTEISFNNKDKNIDVEYVGSVPINNFSSAASTEIFSMYRNKLMNDEDNKTDPSLSSRDGIFSNYEENDEIKSQNLSDHSDDSDSIDSFVDEEKESCAADAIEPSEDPVVQSKNIDESLSLKTNVPPTANTGRNSLDDKNCESNESLNGGSLDNIHEKNTVASVLTRQSLRLKTKTESKCEIDSGEISTSDISKIPEITKKELKLVLTDCKSNFENENSNKLSSSVANLSSCSLTSDNKEDISSQTSVIKKNSSKTKCKSKEIATDSNKSNKRYSLRHNKSDPSTGESENLRILLNKLKFDSPSNKKCTRPRRESKFVKELTSDIKLQHNTTDEGPTKRETRSSTAKSDVGIEPNTPNYNLRNRRTIIAPSKLNV